MENKIKKIWGDYYERGLIGKESYDLIMNSSKSSQQKENNEFV